MDSTTLLSLAVSGYAVLDALDLNPLKLLGQQISPAIIGYIKQELLGDPTYRNQLAKVVNTVLDEYRAEYGVTDRSRVVFFFQLQWIWDRVLAYRLFQATSPLQVADLPQVAGLVIPTQQELDEFDQRVQQAMTTDPELQRRFYEENHQEISVQFALAATQQLTRIEAHLEQQPTVIHSVLDVLEKNTLEHYKPFTTLQLLRDLLLDVQRHPANKALQARFQYLLGRSYQETGNIEAAHDHYLRAHGIDKTNVSYAEQAALAYARLGMLPETEEVIDQLKQLSPLSPVRYAVMLFVQADTLTQRLAQIPPHIARAEAFKLPLVELLLLDKAAHLGKAQLVLQQELENYAPAPQLTFENRRYQALLAQMVVHLEFDRLPLITQLDKVQLLTDRPQLVLAYQTLQRYTQLLAETEKAPQLTHFFFVQGLAGFHLTGDIAEFAEFSRRFDLLPQAGKQGYAWQWACTLFRAQQHQRVLDVLQDADAAAMPDVEYLRYHALRALGNSNAKEALHRHLSLIECIDTLSFDRVLRYLGEHCSDTDERIAAVEACIRRGQVNTPLVELLLRAEVASLADDSQKQLEHYLAKAESLVQDETPAVFRQHMAALFQHAENYARSAEILQDVAGAPGPHHPGGKIIHLRNQYRLFQGGGQLREDLRAWRQEHGVNVEFCSWEVKLAHLLLDWERIVEVTGALKDSVSAKTGARWAYLRALYKLERVEELLAALQEIGSRPELLTADQLLGAAAMAFHLGQADLALALVFPLAMNPENVAARTRFFALYSQDERPRSQPEVVAVGTAVLYTLGGKRQRRLFLTAELLESNPLAKHLIGRHAGDRVEVERGMRNKRVVLQLLEVTDFHTGLWGEINHEITQNESALPFESFSFGTDNPTLEDINRALLDVLGDGPKVRQQRSKQLLGEYRRYEASFFQVAANLHNGNFLEAYHWLTSGREDSPGLVIPAESSFSPVADLAEKALVLDWSSLPLVYALATQQNLSLPPSLWVSLFVLEDLREQVREKKRSKPVEMSIEVVDNQVRPHFYPPEMHARQVSYLEDLLAWTETNCQRRFVPEKLDVVRQSQKGTDFQQQLANYVADTAFLAAEEGAVLVSDDVQVLRLAASCGASVLSTEVFLKAYCPNLYTTCVLPALLDRSYIGLTISAHTLMQELGKTDFAFEGRAHQALRNMVQQVFSAPDHLQEIAHFAREIMTKTNLTPEKQQFMAIKVLSTGLFHLQLDEQALKYVTSCLTQAFWLLPSYQQQTDDIIRLAWRVAAMAQQNLRRRK